MHSDTIFAVASGAGRAAIAVMRVSGPETGRIVASLCRSLPPPRLASLRRLRDRDAGDLDRAIILWMPGPRTYTGEDASELHLHGGLAVIDAVADALVAEGARPAEPGEFTRRAVLNGRMDLLEAEAIGDLIEAETEAQRAQALRQLAGELGALYGGWSARLLRLMANQEALIDFPDEDLPPEVDRAMLVELEALHSEIRGHLDDGRRGERLREGLVFAVVGAPNVGKSSLINALAGRDVAIVSPVPGTTRDAVESRVLLGGVPVTLVDTAGLRETADDVEAEGVRRALTRAAEADLVVAVGVAGEDSPECTASRIVRVANKCDLGGLAGPGVLLVSALTGTGFSELRAALAEEARALAASSGPPALTRARHRAALQAARERLAAAITAPLAELRAEDLRLALRAIGRVTGAVEVEDVLDSIFARFCIGK